MKCLLCGGKMEPKRVEISETVEAEGKHLYYIVTEVPAEVCRQCGETVYTPDVVDKLQALTKRIKKGAPAPKTIEVPVYSLLDAEG